MEKFFFSLDKHILILEQIIKENFTKSLRSKYKKIAEK